MSDFAFVPGVTAMTDFAPPMTVPQPVLSNREGTMARREDALHRIGYVDWTVERSLTPFRTLNVIIDGRGDVISTGVAGDATMDFYCKIVYWKLVADQTGSIVVDIWKDTYTNFAPDVSDQITGTLKPTLSSATKNQDDLLDGWSPLIDAGDILRFNVDSVSTVTRILLALKLETR